jgi:hypothetical protein
MCGEVRADVVQCLLDIIKFTVENQNIQTSVSLFVSIVFEGTASVV